jgi:hypothetical protein
MNTPSLEQETVIFNLSEGNHVTVDACAGSGKTTTILTCALRLPHKQLLMVTYNKQLRVEVQTKVKELSIRNMDVHNYHSLAKKFYSREGHTDTGIRDLLRENVDFLFPIPFYDIIVIDEAQDMTKLYFQFLTKFIKDMPGNVAVQMMVLGDKMQGLYNFKGSDERFLTMAQQCWEKHNRLSSSKFIKCTLKTSYRITNEIADFVNDVMLGEKRLLACRGGDTVRYIRKSLFNVQNIVIATINNLIETQGAKYSDFFCLNASVKNSHVIRRIENVLAEKGIPCFIPSDETQEQIDPRVIENKFVFSTFHSVKGRQRKYVFVFGFDESYFKYFARELPTDVCPSTMYVACTRATDKMFVIESNDNQEDRPLPFLKLNHHEMNRTKYINFQGDPLTFSPMKRESSPNTEYRKSTTPTELIKFIPEDVLDIITPLVQKMFVSMNKYETNVHSLNIPTVIETKKGFFEDVSDLNGIAIPIMFFDKLNKKGKKSILQEIVLSNMREVKEHKHSLLRSFVKQMPETCESCLDYLYMSNLSIATQDKLYSKLTQIDKDEYNWLSDTILEQCFERMSNVIQDECESNDDWSAEKVIIQKSSEIDHHYIDKEIQEALENATYLFRFSARIDLLTKDSIWELKCTSELGMEHKLQLIIYTWLYYMKMNPEERELNKRNSYLFNIRTGEWLKLIGCLNDMTKVVTEIIKGKFCKEIILSDKEFEESIL